MTDVELPVDESARVLAICQQLGIPGLVDIHTHFMPQNVLTKVWDYFDTAEEHMGYAWPIAYRFDQDQRLQQLRDLGVRRFTSLLYPHKPDMAAWLNQWAHEFAEATPDCARTGTFYPEKSAADYVAENIAAGVEVLKAHVQVGAYDPLDPLLDPVWGQIADAGVPVVIHAGSRPVPGPFTGADPIAELMRRHPQLPLVIAHLGMPEYGSFFDLAEQFPNVHLDTCMAFTPYVEERIAPLPREARSRLADLGDKIVLGSDFPNIPYPYVEQIDALVNLDLGDTWLRKVLWENGQRLIGPAGGRS